MGIIKDGTISGVLPEKETFVVHYPGYPSSTSRAIETLGGTEGILKARNSQSNSLELHFRPEDPYSHPALAELRPCSNLLLKISRKTVNEHAMVSQSTSGHSSAKSSGHSSAKMARSESTTGCLETLEYEKQNSPPVNNLEISNNGNEPDMEEAAVSSHLSADLVARVSEGYHFNGMVDYQHVVAVHAAKKRKRHWAEMEPRLAKAGLMDIDQDDMMILVPPRFSLKDVPEKLVLKPSSVVTVKKNHEAIVKDRWEMKIDWCLGIHFDQEEIPSKVNWEDHISQGSDQWEWQMAVSNLFDERPIWAKNSLNHRLLDKDIKLGANMLRRLLFRAAYYFATGPFRRLWIRKGYDPRKDPESRIYQCIDFRVPPSLRNPGESITTDELELMWKDLCAFQVFPCKCQIAFQLFDLVDDYIQQEIRKPPEQTTCLSLTGWFSSLLLDCLRLRVAVRFLSVYPKTGAENLLKSFSQRFEKSKRVHALQKDVRPDASKHQLLDRDSSNQASPITLKDRELVYNDGEDELDDNHGEKDEDDSIEEEEELEYDDYESFQGDGEDGEDDESNLQKCSYPIGENISKNYLQELFGSFPGGGKVQDADYSDGEYQIYDQDSDDNDYDDEDY